jgi:hypothetical protein
MTKKQQLRQELESMGIAVPKSWNKQQLEASWLTEVERIARVCRRVIENAEYYRGCYLWTPPALADMRRRIEFDLSDKIVWKDSEIKIEQYLSCSCRRMRFRTHIERNGNKSNVTILKGILNQIEKETER